jgi:hypothetical protein
MLLTAELLWRNRFAVRNCKSPTSYELSEGRNLNPKPVNVRQCEVKFVALQKLCPPNARKSVMASILR